MKKRKTQQWKVGDFFTAPLNNGTYSIGQVTERELAKRVLGSVFCVFHDKKIGGEEQAAKCVNELGTDTVFSALFTTPDQLNSGGWQIVSTGEPLPASLFFDMTSIEQGNTVGIPVRGSRSVRHLMNAYYALYPWDGYSRSDYFDNLLVSPDKKPSKPLLKNDLSETAN